MWDESKGNEFLKQGDALAKQGDDEGAVEQYMLYCKHLESRDVAKGPDAGRWQLRLTAVRKHILSMMPERRDVRRALVENYDSLGLTTDARAELQRLVREWDALGDLAARDEVMERLRRLA